MVNKKKIIRRIISYILIFAMCVPALSFGINTQIAEAEEMLHFTWQDGLMWGYTDNGDGTVTVGLKNYRADLAADLIIYNKKYPKPSNVTIPRYLDCKLVTGVGWLLEIYVKNIVLPDSIKNIYWGAVTYAGSDKDFESVTIPGSVEYMEDGCIDDEYKGIIYTTSGSCAEQYAKERDLRYYIIEEPDTLIPVEATPSPNPVITPSPEPTAKLEQIVTKRPIIPTEQTTPRPVIPTNKPTSRPVIQTKEPTPKPTVKPIETPRITEVPVQTAEPSLTVRPVQTAKPSPTVRPVQTAKPSSTIRPMQTVKPSPTVRPVQTVKPSSKVTNTPEVLSTIKPEHTSIPDFIGKETPSPKPEYTHKPEHTSEPGYTNEPSKKPEKEVKISVSTLELRTDAQGNFYDNNVNISVTGADTYSAEVKNSSWLKIGKRNSLETASEKIIFTEKDNTNFYVFADKNTNTSERTGSITITVDNEKKTETRTIKVKQEAENTKLSISVSKITANAKGDTSVSSVDVKTRGTGGFSVDNCGYSWIKIGNSNSSTKETSNILFENEGVFYVFVSENTSDKARSGKIKITHENGEAEEIITISQEGRKTILDVDTEEKVADNKGIFYNNTIFVKTLGTGSFTVTVEDAEWLKLSSKNTSVFIDGISTITLDKDSYIYLLAGDNSSDERTATILISHEAGSITKEITVKQLGKDKIYLQIDRESAYFDEPGQNISKTVTVSTNENTTWTATSSNDWIKIVKNSKTQEEQYASIEGTGQGEFYILVKENNTYKEREGHVTVSVPGLEKYEIYVYQAENEISIEALLAELSINVSKKTFKKGKTSKIKLVYPEGLYTSDIKSVKFSSNKKKVATVNSKGIIKGIKKGKAVITVKVTLENGSSKTFKAKITVDKRKVKLSKFK